MKLSLLLLFIVAGVCGDWTRNQALHQPKNLSNTRLVRVANLVNETIFNEILDPILIPRVPGTPGNAQVRKHITDRLEKLPGWHIERHSFSASTPHGSIDFVNIIATHNINAPRRLVLACHHDSKKTPTGFVGATDSAVPCAMMIHLAENLHTYIASRSDDFPELTIQLLFFDGEEAFVKWTSSDSIYGSRKLASRMHSTKTNTPDKTELDSIDVFVLLDLIGANNPIFLNFFEDTTKLYSRMQRIEKKLNDLNSLDTAKDVYFSGRSTRSIIQDDHIPFLQRGVKILHLIPSPFPVHWHKITDNKANLHFPTIMNLQKIVQAFVAEYMHLNV
ncbi:glutaminyl-peptide cyclotransferase-like isoform X2 [Antedon mediterranea]|uniref:glutaminyl-peptide cyclotransferase-like isoform X2 n=1 Tax=Antedon mediterranea TaxID=105859 RepID=UPI003AF7B28E